jgi:hypothetical protein
MSERFSADTFSIPSQLIDSQSITDSASWAAATADSFTPSYDLGFSVPSLRFADIEVDLRTGRLRKHGVKIRLQEQPFKALTALPDAQRHFQHAIELNPIYATAHHWYAEAYLMPTGRVDEATASRIRFARGGL